jgi:hypothetical protein
MLPPDGNQSSAQQRQQGFRERFSVFGKHRDQTSPAQN